MQAIFTILALKHKVVPPTLNLLDADPHLLKGLVGPAARRLQPSGQMLASGMCNSFGFGGTNASLLLRELNYSPSNPQLSGQ